jgi:hypothetical protein
MEKGASVVTTGLNHSMYDIVGVYHKTGLQNYPELGFKQKTLSVLIILKRESFALICKTVMPSFVIVMLCTLSYWLDPFGAAPARISLLITCLLTQVSLANWLQKCTGLKRQICYFIDSSSL